MPRRATNWLNWRQETQVYAIGGDGAPATSTVVPEGPGWSAWLDEVPSFAFHSRSGAACTVRKETVQRGGAYWYAYRRAHGRMVKRYLGRGADLTLARLEEVAEALCAAPSSAGLARGEAAEATEEADGAALDEAADRARADAGARWVTAGSRARRGRVTGEEPRAAAGKESAPAPHLLLTTKLLVPRAPARLVSRPHVQQRLQRGMERPLTLVTAPAGFGKTTALRAWAQEAQELVAWVALDASDNDPAQFWTYVLTALNTAHPGIADTALAMLQAARPRPPSAALRTLLNAVAAHPREVVLVLDDYHLITAPAIHETLAALLEHPPASWHLFLASRSEPPLPFLGRLRAYGQVNEVRANDLRFRPDEVAAFLGDVMDVWLPGEDILRLAERTDGWIAGLQLAGLSLQGHPDPSRFVATFGGGHRRVLAYLGEEVLAAQPEEVQTFLLQTAILERMCAPLCDAVTGRHDGRAMLDRLERANLFVMPLDDAGDWYRYHHLFADLLRQRVQQEQAPQVPQLHRRASRWLEGEGWIVEAAEHLLAVPDADEAARVIEGAATGMLTRGEVAPLMSLINRLPEEVITARPRLALSHALALFFYGKLEMVERRLVAAERGLAAATADAQGVASAGEDDERRTLAGEIASARATLAMMSGDVAGTVTHAQAALAMIVPDNASLRGRVGLPLGIAYMLDGQLRAANTALEEASRLSLAAGNLPTTIIALNIRAVVLELQGQLEQAAAVCRQAIDLTEARGGAARGLVATVYGELGAILYEQNDLIGARLALEKTISLGQQWADGQEQVDGLVRLALVHQAQGQAAAATEAIQQAERVLEHLSQSNAVFPWVTAYAPAVGARLALRQGQRERAEQWVRERGLAVERYTPRSTEFLHEYEYLTLVRVLLAREELDDAARLLERLLQAAQAEEYAGGEIEARALEALVWQARGATDRALDALAQAVARAAPQGYVRLFVDEGAPMRGLLARLRERQPRGSALRRYLDTLLAAFEGASGVGGAAPTGGPGVEPLSEKEREVLHLLAQGRTNQEIARQLVVAVSTVKTHVHHVYAKLQAGDRLQAVTRARELGLLER